MVFAGKDWATGGKGKGGAIAPAAAAGGWGKGKGGGGGGGGGGTPGCKWCELGECWGCPRQRKGGGKGGGKPNLAPVEGIPETSPEEVEGFLEAHTVDDRSKEALRNLDARLQTLVLARGGMEEARDQNSMLMGRIRTVSSMKEGDWVCPSCYDHQFSKNDVCRQCQTPKPV